MHPRFPAPGGVTFVNARLSGGEIGSLRIVGSRIAAYCEKARTGDRVMDLQGDRVLPGLINAHDHLHLNSLLPLESGKHYRNAHAWIMDVDARRKTDPAFEASARVSRDRRLAVGGMKNLLSGVTTVAHHDRLYPFLSNPGFPTQVIDTYGWAHSLYIDGEARVRDSYRRTPDAWPWIIHAAEGLDEAAAGEFERLDAMGCLRANTLIVHGIALDRAQRGRLERAAAGLLWCPSSNLRLFGKTADTAELIARGRVALGTDSRLSGGRDLLDELRVAAESSGLDDPTLESLVTGHSARLLRLSDRGTLKVGARADILILPAGTPLSGAVRADVRLVMVGGIVRYGDAHYACAAAPTSRWAQVRVDGKSKVLEAGLADLLADTGAREPGLEFTDPAWRAA
jgi:cytosine/adenosine deaminase-related metal-dependent hydrolase